MSQDHAAAEEMKRINGGQRSVPTIVVCEQVMVGFNPARLEQMLNCLENRSSLPA